MLSCKENIEMKFDSKYTILVDQKPYDNDYCNELIIETILRLEKEENMRLVFREKPIIKEQTKLRNFL